METWELTEYELERRPQEVTIDSEIALSPRCIYREILCPICLETLSQTRAAPDCLHRFCKKCLDKALKKECPVCRKKLPSQIKSFREDPMFDQLIAKLFNGYRTKPAVEPTNRITTVPECEVVLKSLDGQQSRYIKCPFTATVDHLSKYLSIRPESSKMPELNKTEQYKLCIVGNRAKGHYKQLPGNLKLEEILDNHKLESDKPMELYFYSPP